MATAERVGYGVGDTLRRNKNRIITAAVNALVPTTALVQPATQAANTTKEFAGGVMRGASGEKPPEEPQVTAAPEPDKTEPASVQAAPPPVVEQPVAEPAKPAVDATQVAQQDTPVTKPALGIRKIVDANGATTYTNDESQRGGKPLDEGGTLSVIGDPRTEGMTQAQAAEYWQNKSDQIDAKRRLQDVQAQSDNNRIGPTDSIATILSKRANRRGIDSDLNAAADQVNAFGVRGANMLPKVQTTQEQQQQALVTESAQLGVRGKRAELKQQEQIDALRQQYANESDPEKRRALATKINTLTGKDQQKFQVVMEKGVGADGITPTQTAYLVDEAGNVKPVSGGGQPDTNVAPPGMRMVGTSQGKPVYEDAQGNRFTLD
jgi:hypothetical protein